MLKGDKKGKPGLPVLQIKYFLLMLRCKCGNMVPSHKNKDDLDWNRTRNKSETDHIIFVSERGEPAKTAKKSP